eukprot:NODE_261_length_12589_cov_0.423139.p9 type:complete len:116 gc:universal NODE_261_length_12589_cov_0.423139:5727-5380(-)
MNENNFRTSLRFITSMKCNLLPDDPNILQDNSFCTGTLPICNPFQTIDLFRTCTQCAMLHLRYAILHSFGTIPWLACNSFFQSSPAPWNSNPTAINSWIPVVLKLFVSYSLSSFD